MINIENNINCCGCGACSQICPQKCIEMKADAEGFLYPIVTKANDCINCGLCNKACPIGNRVEEDKQDRKEPIAYGVQHKNEQVRQDSSSGGAFTLMAEYVLAENGLVFGCRLDENMHAVHIGIDSMDELSALRGSKYVQSEIGQVYKEIKTAITKGKKVLFVGTPCQAAGLFSFLGNKVYDNLYIVDFICHGVPSPKVFQDYIKSEELKHNAKVIKHTFRNKDHGWNQTGLQLGSNSVFENGTSTRRYPAFKDKYMNGFLDDVYLRPSCYDCKFKKLPKVYSDCTIADFWGINKVNPELNDKSGTSLVLVNTQHGEELWKLVKDNCVSKEVKLEDAIRRNKPLIESAKPNSKREKFFSDYQNKGYQYVEKKYMSAFTWAFHKAVKIIKSLINKFEQFIKFAIVGCSNTLINLLVYYLLLFLGVHYLFAYTVSFLVSVCNAFYWNNKFVFKNKQEKSILKAFIKVFASYGISFGVSILLMSIMIEVLHISSYIAPILKLAITIPMNFVLNKVWAFKDKKGIIKEDVIPSTGDISDNVNISGEKPLEDETEDEGEDENAKISE